MSQTTSLPNCFEGTTRQTGSREHAFLRMRIVRTWNHPDNRHLRLFKGIFQHLGPPSAGKGFLLSETDFFGEWDRDAGTISLTEAIPVPNGPTGEKTFHGSFSPDYSMLFADRSDGAEQLNLFAKS